VSAAYQRRGIGKRLIAALAALAKKRGCVYAWLGTDKENDAAQACFASVPDAEPAQDFLLYAWDLED
jgi:ribosomal protein S18 acetylase RimI-like enzyme